VGVEADPGEGVLQKAGERRERLALRDPAQRPHARGPQLPRAAETGVAEGDEVGVGASHEREERRRLVGGRAGGARDAGELLAGCGHAGAGERPGHHREPVALARGAQGATQRHQHQAQDREPLLAEPRPQEPARQCDDDAGQQIEADQAADGRVIRVEGLDELGRK